ncbi:hypothetical protein EBU60_01050 [bacterium]|nr:hypothetical protein [bacterium]
MPLRQVLQVVSQGGLGLFLSSAGYSHLTANRIAFQAQVPTWLPIDPDIVVLASGIVEIALGLALLTLWRYRAYVGLVTALFFVAIFPGNINQFVNGIDAFGLNSDLARGVRLLFQPILVLWALWSTEAMRLVRRGERHP